MLSDIRTCEGYGEEYNYYHEKETMPQSGQKMLDNRYRKSAEEQDEIWAKIELSTNKLYKYRKYDVRLFVKKSMRIKSGASEIDVLKSLLSAKCYCEGTRSEPFCNKCHTPKVISLDTAKNTQNIKVDRGEYEIYTCIITSKCSSSRDHIHASLVLVIDGYPFTRPLVSAPFGLYSREKKAEKKQFIEQTISFNNESLGYNFGYSETSRENEMNRVESSQKNGYPEYTTEPSISTVSSTKNFTDYLYETSNFIGLESTALSTSVAMPTESFSNNAMLDYDNYTEKYGNYMDTTYTHTKEPLQLQPPQLQPLQEHQKYHLPPPSQPPQLLSLPSEQVFSKAGYNEPTDDFRYLMPEYFVASIQQKCLPFGPPPGNPTIVGTGEGAPDPADCL